MPGAGWMRRRTRSSRGSPRSAQPKILLINKVDLVDKSALACLVKAANERVAFAATFMISALTGDGVADVSSWLAAHVPPGPWHYPEDQITDAPLRQLAAEITREKLYLRLHQELPYQSTVETEAWKELKDGSVRIEQTIYVERESQRKIVLGKGGQTIKAIGADARREIADMIEAAGAPVPVRQGARGLGRRSGALSRDGARVSKGIQRDAMDRRRHRAWPRRHGEANAILELMTRAHGRHLGLVRGGAGSRLRPVLQPGNRVSATWRARLDEHLGHYAVEGLDAARRLLSAVSHAVYGMTHLAALCRLLPERDPHPQIHAALEEVARPAARSAPCRAEVVRFELQLLAELGFGLDLATCAATGQDPNWSTCRRNRARGVARRRASHGRTGCCGCRRSCARRVDGEPSPQRGRRWLRAHRLLPAAPRARAARPCAADARASFIAAVRAAAAQRDRGSDSAHAGRAPTVRRPVATLDHHQRRGASGAATVMPPVRWKRRQ